MEGQESRVYRSKVDASGRIVLPAELRSELGLLEGSPVLVIRDGLGVHIETPAHALDALQAYFQDLVPANVSLADELIADRRAEAERD
jgi:AbrB family looped-hinge helix DNA binding protein